MTKISELTQGRFMGADDVTDGTVVKLVGFDKVEARDPKTGKDGEVEVCLFQDSNGNELKQSLIITKTRGKNLGEMGIVDTELPIPDDFPLVELVLVDTQLGQGIRMKAAGDDVPF